MTNILADKREQLFATHRARGERCHASPPSASSRASSASICMSARWRSRCSPDKAANRSFLIDPQRRDRRALRQDPHVRRRSRRRRELSRVAQLPAGRDRGAADLPWGRLGLTICYDLRFPGALSRAGRSRRIVPRDSVRLHPADRRGALARADARARDRERLLRVRGRAGRQARGRPRDLRPFADRRSLGPYPRRRRHRAGRGDRRDRSGARSRRRARAFPRCSMAGASRWSSRWPSRRICMSWEGRA